MYLKVKGIGKINDSTIEMKGLTVIAGENNTGKSTFGKTLYCMFNVFRNADDKIYDARVNEIRRIFRGSLPRFHFRFLGNNAINDILSDKGINEIINNTIDFYSTVNPKPDTSTVDSILERIKRSISIDKNEIHQIIVTHCFRQEFAGKINHLNKPDKQSEVSLIIKRKNIDVCINYNECTLLNDDVGLLHDAIYIDTPFIMDDIKNYDEDGYGFYDTIKHRNDLLERLSSRKSNNNVLEEVLFKQKINNILSAIHSVVKGEFKEDENDLMFNEQGIKKPVPLSSVSTGIKTFLVIKRLLELGEIKERDILILDEPEIHLHPAWQLKFAEILVLLQKEFKLTILLTTHSPYFLNAIEVYSEKHNIPDDSKYYLAKNNDDTSDVHEVTDNIDEVYQQLAAPFHKLDKIAYEE